MTEKQTEVEAALEKARWTADDILGEFHGFLYDLAQEAEAAGDARAHDLASYIHDQFILYRTRARGEEKAPAHDWAKRPTFQPSEKAAP